MGLPNRYDLLLGCALLALLQAAILLRFLVLLLRRAPVPSRAAPAAAVIVPCAGADPGLDERVRALLAQSYPGPVRFVFVTPSRSDPAHAVLAARASAHGAGAEVLASERAPRGRSGKIEDLLFALERLAPDAELLAFADADALVPPGWLESLAGALEEPGAGIATATMIYLPARASPGPLLRFAWTAFGAPFFAWTGGVTGQSWAIRRADFEALGLRELWSRSLYEDLAMSVPLRGWTKAVRFVPAACPVTPDGAPVTEALAVFGKWIRAYRFYDRRVWLLGAAVTAVKAVSLAAALVPPVHGRLLALALGMDAAFLAVFAAAAAARFPDRFRAHGLPGPLWIWAAASAPLLQLCLALNYAGSVLSRDIRWGGRVYRVHGPQRIEILEGAGR